LGGGENEKARPIGNGLKTGAGLHVLGRDIGLRYNRAARIFDGTLDAPRASLSQDRAGHYAKQQKLSPYEYTRHRLSPSKPMTLSVYRYEEFWLSFPGNPGWCMIVPMSTLVNVTLGR
jgi:hypothetical protein